MWTYLYPAKTVVRTGSVVLFAVLMAGLTGCSSVYLWSCDQEPMVSNPLAPYAGVHFFSDCPDCPDMAALPAGAFIMGGEPRGVKESQSIQSPPHCATVRRPFAIGRTEVTVAQWQACVDAGRCRPLLGKRERRPNEPAADTTWTMAREYVAWLSERTGQIYRLPSEVEWEYAARAGTDTLYWWGAHPLPGMENMIICPSDSHGEGDDRCQGPRRILPVASFRVNAFGLYDTIGNAREWVEDLYSQYKKEPKTEVPLYPTKENRHVFRGGIFRSYPDPKADEYPSTVDVRNADGPSVEYLEKKGSLTGDTYGFRVARDLP